MRAESIVFGIAGSLFGLIIGWVLGSQQPAGPGRLAAPAAVLDADRVKALESVAGQNPNDAQPRVQLGNLYFDAEQYNQAITWYEQALKLNPRDPNVSTDLGVAYYYTNQPDRALSQFDASLAIDARHIKTLLNMGIVRAFGKQDLAGAAKAWEQVVAISPDSPEGQAAKKGLEGLKNAHPEAGAGGK